MSSSNPFFRSLFIAGILCMLFSCKAMQKMQEDQYNARDKDHKAFVKKKDGEIIDANEARMRMPLFGKTTIELDENLRVPLKEVQAFQNNTAFYYRTPLGFAPRIKKGWINVYLATTWYTTYDMPSSNGNFGGSHTHTRTVYYLQKGDDAEVQTMKPSLVQNYVQDYAPAMEYIDLYLKTQKKVQVWSIVNTAAVVGGLLLAPQGIKNSQVAAAGYASAGLILGGLVNGVVNKIRRSKNARNLELAIDEYNTQKTRKKSK